MRKSIELTTINYLTYRQGKRVLYSNIFYVLIYILRVDLNNKIMFKCITIVDFIKNIGNLYVRYLNIVGWEQERPISAR